MKTLLILVQMIIGITIFSQGNLQFNKAFDYSQSITNTTGGYLTGVDTTFVITVPNNKVWKINYAGMYVRNHTTNRMAATSYGSQVAGLFIDRNILIGEATTASMFLDNVLWLNQGTYTVKLNASQIRPNFQVISSFSGIEFNVLP